MAGLFAAFAASFALRVFIVNLIAAVMANMFGVEIGSEQYIIGQIVMFLAVAIFVAPTLRFVELPNANE